MNKLSAAALSLTLLGLTLTSALAGNGTYVAVPEVTWLQLVPYLRANLTVSYVDDQLRLGASSWSREQEVAGPYDARFDELVKVLITEALDRRRVSRAVSEAMASLSPEERELGRRDPEAFKAVYWERLVIDGRFLYHVRELFERARAEGRLACYICGHGFQPEHLSRPQS